mmetsp:Transcript_2474/g.7594  ORF Transcript_2474/g.7594 Transcript_2474/m.7594 type:complete len:300 (-) Transcript_2474:53-952(-)
MLKTTRFRPIAPRPQEGVNASKEKLSTTIASVTPTQKTVVETKKAPTLSKAPHKQQQQPTKNNDVVIQAESEISLDPKNFCYPDLKSACSDFETSSAMSSGLFGGYNYNYYNNSCYQGYAAQNACHIQHCGASAGTHCNQQLPWNSGGQQQGPNCYNRPSSFNSMSSVVDIQRKEKLMNGSDNNNSLAMKLDLDEDSVAKAFGENRGGESDGSVDGGNDSAPSDEEDKTKSPDKSRGRITKAGSRVGFNGFVNCIAKGSTNPLFHIDKQLACDFIKEFLDQNEDLDLMKMGNSNKKQKI